MLLKRCLNNETTKQIELVPSFKGNGKTIFDGITGAHLNNLKSANKSLRVDFITLVTENNLKGQEPTLK